MSMRDAQCHWHRLAKRFQTHHIPPYPRHGSAGLKVAHVEARSCHFLATRSGWTPGTGRGVERAQRSARPSAAGHCYTSASPTRAAQITHFTDTLPYGNLVTQASFPDVESLVRIWTPRVAAGCHVRHSGLPITVMLQLMGPLAVCSSAEPRRRGVHEGAVHGDQGHVKA